MHTRATTLPSRTKFTHRLKVCAILWLMVFYAPCLLTAAMDLNGNGLGDVWEQYYDAGGQAGVADEDGDGQSDAQEERAGTDPKDPASRFRASEIRAAGGGIVVGWPTHPGKAYRILCTTNLNPAQWTPVTAFQVAGGDHAESTISTNNTFLPRRRDLLAQPAREDCFFKIEVQDVDSDGDGLTDWEERKIQGFDPHNAQSKTPGMGDGDKLAAMLAGGINAVDVSTPVAVAIEKEAVDGVFRINRKGSLRAVDVRFTLGGDSDPQKDSASMSDFDLVGEDGQPVNGMVHIPFGVQSVDVRVRPRQDTNQEAPETLTMAIAPDSAYALDEKAAAGVSITDAANTAANQRLFLGYLVPGGGSSATGVATIRLQGDNSTAEVSLSFSGLTSRQTTSVLSLNNGGSGAYIKGLPQGQVTDNLWALKAAGFLSKRQAMLDALLAGHIAAVVNSDNFLDGEIRGNFRLVTGSTDPPVPDEPPPVGTLTGEALRRDVARFLTQATFGPTEADIDALVTRIETQHGGDGIAGYSAWIDEQFALDQTKLEDYTRAADAQEWVLRGTDPINYTTATGNPGNQNRRRAWWAVSVGAQDQLRQRVGFALSEIMVISDKTTVVSQRHYGAAHYYDMLAAHADGNFSDLLRNVSMSPMMGTYLSSLQNQKAVYDPTTGLPVVSPDENYAREVMQLFTIGLVQLHPDGSLKLGSDGLPIPTYNNNDITELARVFTGWSFSRRHGSKATGYPELDNTIFAYNNGPLFFQASWTNPMKNFAAYHDTGAKSILGREIPAGLSGPQDLQAALDILFHHPNVPPFICRRLIQRLVTSNPSAGYIHRVGQAFIDDGTGTRGNLRAVIKAILLDPEARSLAVAGQFGFGKQKEPIIRYVQLLRAFGAKSRLPLADLSAYGYPATQLDNFATGATRFRFAGTDGAFNQTPQSSPTVFNYFLPDYSPGDAISAAGLVAPEMQITTEIQVVQSINYHRNLLNVNSGQGVQALFGATDASLDNVIVSRAPWETFYTSQISAGKSVTQAVTALVDRLDMLLLSGQLKARYASAPAPNPRASIIEAGVGTPATADRVMNVLYLVASAPEFMHQK
ncbi:MAG: DUF1800 family protein [Chthoniobacterales bacterium]